MPQRAFRIELGREGYPGQERRAESRIVIGRDEPRSARPVYLKPGFFIRYLVAVHNAPLALLLRARRFFTQERVLTFVLVAVVGGLMTWFWFAAFGEMWK